LIARQLSPSNNVKGPVPERVTSLVGSQPHFCSFLVIRFNKNVQHAPYMASKAGF